MDIKLEDVFFTGYDDSIQIDNDTLIVAAWNEYATGATGCEKFLPIIYKNNKKFFENTAFGSRYDAALAVSLSNKWQWTDRFVYFDFEGYLTSFSHWDDENSPIQIDKIDINNLINELKRCCKKGYVNNIPRAIHDALKE